MLKQFRPVHLYEPVILDEEDRNYHKWLNDPKGKRPLKFDVKSYSEYLGNDPKELYPTLLDCKDDCELCNYYKDETTGVREI